MKIPAGSVLQTDRMHLQGLAQQQDHTTVGSVTIHLFSDLQGGPSSRGGQRIGARLQEELNDLLKQRRMRESDARDAKPAPRERERERFSSRRVLPVVFLHS